MFHLGWFLKGGIGVQGWSTGWTGAIATSWMKPDLYIDMARALEEAGFDYIMIEDSLMIRDTYKSNMQFALARAISAPKMDPMPMIPLIAQATSRIGIIATLATSFTHPFHAARLGATLDLLTQGRVGLNLVTASAHRSAQNFGYDEHFEHDHRYEMAEEWMEVANALWNSWEPDAIVADEEQRLYVDHEKVHPINFSGRFYKCRGPLNVCPGPQRRPVICQAGGSNAGRSFAAKHADTIVGAVGGVAGMKAYRKDMSERMRSFGRRPEDCKLLFLVAPVLGDTVEEAQAKNEREKAATAADLEARLSNLSYVSGLDMAQFDLDGPVPAALEKGNGHQSVVAEYIRSGKTLRQMLSYSPLESIEIVGTPESAAAQMGEIMDEVGGDGFLISNAVTRKSIGEITGGLVPALKRRGLVRKAYAHEHFRANLLEF
jgi:FMN-dependent oxidoreductase (nitrilotriacetate monooxygenase family)